MRWASLTIEAEDEGALAAAEHLCYSADIKGVAIVDDSTPRRITGYLPEDDRLEGRIRAIDAALAILPSLGIAGVSPAAVVGYIEEDDWANAWKKYFKPTRVGTHLIVTPPWETPELGAGDIPIVIDPGMAFGTGSHATTQLCLMALENLVQTGAKVADIGTGSGILAIAAAKLGASSVWAMDNDPLAARIAGENAIANGVSILTGEAMPQQETFDVVVANIIADTLIALAPQLASITAPTGTLVVSGIIDHRARDVQKAFDAAGMAHEVDLKQGEWIAQKYHWSKH
ncbi:MAG: 50S ribosomal protein L11 methyltransferase [Capsulimonadaceae bacterium]|nr:50S ribosomal protein L11 methyltransferase [Capsulimonadaceae bacterium]